MSHVNVNVLFKSILLFILQKQKAKNFRNVVTQLEIFQEKESSAFV